MTHTAPYGSAWTDCDTSLRNADYLTQQLSGSSGWVDAAAATATSKCGLSLNLVPSPTWYVFRTLCIYKNVVG